MFSSLKNLANGWIPDTPAAKMRQKRFGKFLELLDSFSDRVDILDVGGQENFWKVVGVEHEKIRSITLLNLHKEHVSLPKLSSVVGDVRNLLGYPDRSFDVVFSNSVVEHVGGLREQQRAAREIQRVGRAYFVQTPNRYFPLEPHFLTPCFQFFPLRIRAELHHRFDLGWWKRQPDYFEALAEVESIRLLGYKEFRHLFPGAEIIREKFAGLTKSFFAYEITRETEGTHP